MPFHDLHVPYTASAQDLTRTLAFHAELGYSEVAVALSISGKIPATPQTVSLEDVEVPKSINMLTRLTLTITDPTQNHRLASLQPLYNLIALRPTTEKALQLCCGSLDCDLISLDLSQRLPFILKFRTVSSALQRGIRFEICYSPSITGGSDARRNLISGATALIRATRGRGLIISSEAKSALGLRGPWDVINLGVVWGLGQERGKEAVCEEAGKVIKLARLKRESYRGVIDLVYGGEKPEGSKNAEQPKGKENVSLVNGTKRKAADSDNTAHPDSKEVEKPLSKGEMKRRAKKAKLEGKGQDTNDTPKTKNAGATPILHETLAGKGKG